MSSTIPRRTASPGIEWLANETTNQTARRFDSRENPTASNRPVLTIDYALPQPGGSIPDGDTRPGTPLTIRPALRLSFDSAYFTPSA